MMSKSDNVISTSNLSKTYNETVAIRNLNLKVKKTSIFGFLGPNGAGKTTTIKLLIGLIQPTGGTGKIFGYDISEDSLKIRSRIGYLAQSPSFYNHLTARETLEFTARFFFSGPNNAIDERIREVLELVSLMDISERRIKGFSGGEKQRLGIAQAMINYPDLLILDEPTASLDPLGRHDMLEIMKKLRDHTTIFYSTHILDDVQKVSDTVGILYKGELITQGQIEEILADKTGVVFRASVQGDISKVKNHLLNLQWVKNVNIIESTGSNTSKLEIEVTDSEIAQKQLMRELMKDPTLTVTDFSQQEHELEDIFIKKIKGIEQ
jgi:ABC-2 type transport system ATP-binding protein